MAERDIIKLQDDEEVHRSCKLALHIKHKGHGFNLVCSKESPPNVGAQKAN